MADPAPVGRRRDGLPRDRVSSATGRPDGPARDAGRPGGRHVRPRPVRDRDVRDGRFRAGLGHRARRRSLPPIAADHQLVPDSTQIDVGDAVIVGQRVSFPVTASAEQVAVLDPAELEAMVLGKPVEEAKAILAPFGEVEISVSPDWAGTIPSFESRVDLTVEHPVEVVTPDRDGPGRPRGTSARPRHRPRRLHDPLARDRPRGAPGRSGPGRRRRIGGASP